VGYSEGSTAVESEGEVSSFTLTPSYTPTISHVVSQSGGQGEDVHHHEVGQENPIPIPVPPCTRTPLEGNDQDSGEDHYSAAPTSPPPLSFHTLDTALRPHPDLHYTEQQGKDMPALSNQRGQAIHGERGRQPVTPHRTVGRPVKLYCPLNTTAQLVEELGDFIRG
jgi:hypothetical protein